jgi:hypothetical protein
MQTRQVRKPRMTAEQNRAHARKLTDAQIDESLKACPLKGGCAGCSHLRDEQERRKRKA